jgi:3-oxoacyl-[acyl-carrier-protein] synthase-3
MRFDWPIEIAGTGMALPDRVVTNEEIAAMVDTSHDWIVQRTGIHERRWVGEGESTLTLATAASRDAIANAGLTPEDIDLIVFATITPEHPLPATACLLQSELGCRWIPAFDMASACSGFVWAALQAAQFVHSGMAKNVLVVGAEALSSITDMQDRATCILFGDAASAMVMRPATNDRAQFIAGKWGADGARGRLITVPAGGSKMPACQQTLDERLHFMRMAGREVYKFAVTQMYKIIHETCEEGGVAVEDLKLIVPHQSNLRIIESATQKAGVPLDKVVVNINRYGNTSAASVPVALAEAIRDGRCGPGDLVLLVAFGAGLTWGSLLLRM